MAPISSRVSRPDCTTEPSLHADDRRPSKPLAFGASGLIGLIGLGGAEFRLPVLIGVFQFAALAAIFNQTMSLVVVASALPFRFQSVPLAAAVSAGRPS